MAKIRGNDLILFVQQSGVYQALAYSTTCEIDMQAEVIRVSSPDTGQWAKKKKKRKDWSVSSGCLISDSKQTLDLFNMYLNDEPIIVMLGTVAPHAEAMNAINYVPDERLKLRGEALVTRITITGKRGDFVTMSITLDGCGELNMGLRKSLEVTPSVLNFGTSLEPQKLSIVSELPWRAYILEE